MASPSRGNTLITLPSSDEETSRDAPTSGTLAPGTSARRDSDDDADSCDSQLPPPPLTLHRELSAVRAAAAVASPAKVAGAAGTISTTIAAATAATAAAMDESADAADSGDDSRDHAPEPAVAASAAAAPVRAGGGEHTAGRVSTGDKGADADDDEDDDGDGEEDEDEDEEEGNDADSESEAEEDTACARFEFELDLKNFKNNVFDMGSVLLGPDRDGASFLDEDDGLNGAPLAAIESKINAKMYGGYVSDGGFIDDSEVVCPREVTERPRPKPKLASYYVCQGDVDVIQPSDESDEDDLMSPAPQADGKKRKRKSTDKPAKKNRTQGKGRWGDASAKAGARGGQASASSSAAQTDKPPGKRKSLTKNSLKRKRPSDVGVGDKVVAAAAAAAPVSSSSVGKEASVAAARRDSAALDDGNDDVDLDSDREETAAPPIEVAPEVMSRNSKEYMLDTDTVKLVEQFITVFEHYTVHYGVQMGKMRRMPKLLAPLFTTLCEAIESGGADLQNRVCKYLADRLTWAQRTWRAWVKEELKLTTNPDELKRDLAEKVQALQSAVHKKCELLENDFAQKIGEYQNKEAERKAALEKYNSSGNTEPPPANITKANPVPRRHFQFGNEFTSHLRDLFRLKEQHLKVSGGRHDDDSGMRQFCDDYLCPVWPQVWRPTVAKVYKLGRKAYPRRLGASDFDRAAASLLAKIKTKNIPAPTRGPRRPSSTLPDEGRSAPGTPLPGLQSAPDLPPAAAPAPVAAAAAAAAAAAPTTAPDGLGIDAGDNSNQEPSQDPEEPESQEYPSSASGTAARKQSQVLEGAALRGVLRNPLVFHVSSQDSADFVSETSSKN